MKIETLTFPTLLRSWDFYCWWVILVMVGDHRQLPPMLDAKTLEEVSQEIGSTNTELQLLQESLFKIQFESANDRIKQMLNIQYRMHPIIMGAINQFYDGKLECGILEPDKKRAHNLAGKIIKESGQVGSMYSNVSNIVRLHGGFIDVSRLFI
ncbi:MAG: AAA domain-containing protein [Nostoc sp.]